MATVSMSQPVAIVPQTSTLTVSGVFINLDDGNATITCVPSGNMSIVTPKVFIVKATDAILSDVADLVKAAFDANFGGPTSTVTAKASDEAKVALGK